MYAVQVLELAAGATPIARLGLNMWDTLKRKGGATSPARITHPLPGGEQGWAQEVRLQALGASGHPKVRACRELDRDDAARLVLVAWLVKRGGNGGCRFRRSPLP